MEPMELSLPIDKWEHYESSEWMVFEKKSKADKESPQVNAFAYADTHGGLPVFGKNIHGRSYSFLVTGWNRFFKEYLYLPKEERLYTELIRPGVPINFYVDAELIRSANEGFEPGSEKEKQILEETRFVCKQGLIRNFPHIKEEDIEIYETDASNAEKLSKHMTFRIKEKALFDHKTAKIIFNDIEMNASEHSILRIIDEKTKEKSFFLDCSVYSKNRHFRIYQSRKHGNYRFLCYPGVDGPGDTPNLEILKKTLITYFSPLERMKLAILQLKSDEKRKVKGPARKKRDNGTKSTVSSHWLAAELERITDFKVYKTEMEEDGASITFSIESKLCEINGPEPHDGNHIKYVLNLIDKTYHQECYARACKDKIGSIKPIPEKFHASINKYMREEKGRLDYNDVFKDINFTDI